MKLTLRNADDFTRGYIDAALFTTDEHPPSGCDYVECGRADEMWEKLPLWFLEQAEEDCRRFKEEQADNLVDYPADQAGHDFWMTRQGEGVGFWEVDFGTEEQCEHLDKAAKVFGEVYLMPEDIGQTTTD